MEYLEIVGILGSEVIEILIELGLGALEKTKNVGFGRFEHVSSELLECVDFFRLRRSSFLHEAHDVFKHSTVSQSALDDVIDHKECLPDVSRPPLYS